MALRKSVPVYVTGIHAKEGLLSSKEERSHLLEVIKCFLKKKLPLS